MARPPKGKVARHKVLQYRADLDEVHKIELAAHLKRVTVSEYLRDAANATADRDVAIFARAQVKAIKPTSRGLGTTKMKGK